jgi:hypothetical protein
MIAIRGFVSNSPMGYQKHCKIIAQLLAEGMHNGEEWKPEAFSRYNELENTNPQPISPQSKACRNPNHALTDGTPSPHEIGPSCMAEQSKAPEPQKLTQHVCDCGRRLLVEGLVIGTERL